MMFTSKHTRWAFQATSAAVRCSNRSLWAEGAASTWSETHSPLRKRLFSASAKRWAAPKPKPKPKPTPTPKPTPKPTPTATATGPRGGGGGGGAARGEDKQTLSELFERRKVPLIGMGLAAAVIGGYVAMLTLSMTSGPAAADGDSGASCCTAPSGRPLDLRQGKISATLFDRDLDRPESLMGVTGLRKVMGGLARGHVLEVAVGTGRNIEYVDWGEIRACAPPVPQLARVGSGDVRGQPVKSEAELERERVARRLERGEKGMLSPGDQAPEVVSYTGVDVSVEVLEVAWGKLKSAVPELIPRRRRRSDEGSGAEQRQQQQQQSGKATAAVQPTSTPAPSSTGSDETLAANIGQGRIRLFKSDAQLSLPPPPAVVSHDGSRVLPAPSYYDTILQNFGLCSVSDPHALLVNMAAALQPGTGRIYLLEHGRGSYGWLNKLLDRFAPSHFERYGCWWNRDIEALVRRAEREVPGLEVVAIERPLLLQGGTMLWIELRVDPDRSGGGIGGARK